MERYVPIVGLVLHHGDAERWPSVVAQVGNHMRKRDPRVNPKAGDVCKGTYPLPERIVVYNDPCPAVRGGAWIGFKPTKRSKTWATTLYDWRKWAKEAEVVNATN